jgi:hypothetical protein
MPCSSKQAAALLELCLVLLWINGAGRHETLWISWCLISLLPACMFLSFRATLPAQSFVTAPAQMVHACCCCCVLSVLSVSDLKVWWQVELPLGRLNLLLWQVELPLGRLNLLLWQVELPLGRLNLLLFQDLGELCSDLCFGLFQECCPNLTGRADQHLSAASVCQVGGMASYDCCCAWAVDHVMLLQQL